MSLFKKKIKVEQEFVQCDFCDRSDVKTKSNLYIMKCAVCNADVCPEHRYKADESVADNNFLCPVCAKIWDVVKFYDKMKGK